MIKKKFNVFGQVSCVTAAVCLGQAGQAQAAIPTPVLQLVGDSYAAGTWTATYGSNGTNLNADSTVPTALANAANGHTAVDFSRASSQFLTVPDDATQQPGTGDFTFLVVGRYTSAQSLLATPFLGKGNAGSTAEGYSLFVDKSSTAEGSLTGRVAAGTKTTAGSQQRASNHIALPVNEFAVMCVTISSAGANGSSSTAMYVNGSSAGVIGGGGGPSSNAYFNDANGIANTDAIQIGQLASGTNTVYLDGDILEVREYNTALSASDVAALSTQLMNTYAIATPEPASLMAIFCGSALMLRRRRR